MESSSGGGQIHRKSLERSFVCGFEGMSISSTARWLSWLERRPVTAEVVGSNPIRVVGFLNNLTLTDTL